MTISERIFLLLKEKGLTQKALSEYTGISQPAITDWKKKGTNPSADKIVKLSEFLGVSVYYLLTGKEESFPASQNTDIDMLLELYNSLTDFEKGRLLGNLEEYLKSSNSFLCT